MIPGVDGEGPREAYRPVKDEGRLRGLNPHVWRHIKIWALFCAICVPACAGLLGLSMYLDPADPTMNQIRFAVIKASACVIGFLGLTGFVIFMEAVTNGNLIGNAISTPRGAAYLAAALVLAGALVMVLM